MAHEIEMKLKVKGFESVFEKLNALEAKFDSYFVLADDYYDDAQDSLKKSDAVFG